MQDVAQDCRTLARQLRQLPRDLRQDLARDVRDNIARPLAMHIRASGTTVQARRVAATARPLTGTEPRLAIGSTRRAGSGGITARQLLYPVEFGGGTRRQPSPVRASRRARAHVRRNTTAQFRRTQAPFIYDTISQRLPKALEALADVIVERLANATRTR